MRFLPDGPNIPDELLESRDQGNVVFLCGAGVSYPAGMPTFLGLAKHVVHELGAPDDAQSRKLLAQWDREDLPEEARPPLDQIFNQLQQVEYTPREIDHQIAKRLKTKSNVRLLQHETILRLSRNAAGKPQIVTTNFDCLFEKAAPPGLKTHVPALPDLSVEQAFEGLVYLHGRINPEIKPGEGRQGFVVSSSDFGRAYLAEGWAARFVRDLLEQYTVVLLGYSANDPPVRYLLEGLHTRERGPRGTLYAFDSGADEEVEPRWWERGVRPIPYPKTTNRAALWDTLCAWAQRADDPMVWKQRIIELAGKGPRKLEAHERGQVASLVRSDDGANLFADAVPPPPAEWLCVFDEHLRYGPIVPSFDESQPGYDPLAVYRLDDDPPRPSNDDIATENPRINSLLSRSVDDPASEFVRLAYWRHPRGPNRLPPRLRYLARWTVNVAHEPVTVWWAARYQALHPDLLDLIEQWIAQNHDVFPLRCRSLWRLLIERFHEGFDDNSNLPWYKPWERIKKEDWTRGILRAFERSSAPHLAINSSSTRSDSEPPGVDWSGIPLGRIARFKVAFPTTRLEPPDIPDDVLTAVYQVLRRHLELAVGLLADIETEPQYWRTSTFYPEFPSEDGAVETYSDDASKYLFWFRDLFDRMAEVCPDVIRADAVFWPREEPFFFNKLSLWAWTKVLFSGEEVGDGLLSLSDEAFWERHHSRELLHLLKSRWYDLPPDIRTRLERRLAAGRAKQEKESKKDCFRNRSIESAIRLGWLMEQGCELSDETKSILPKLRAADPNWCHDWDVDAAKSFDMKVFSGKFDDDPSAIINAPLDQIIPLATELTRESHSEHTSYRPFDGLVGQRPRKAVAALANAARRGNYPEQFWSAAMRCWPDGQRARLVWLFGARLARLPSRRVFELRRDVFSWLEKHLPALTKLDQPRALGMLDVLLDKLFQAGPDATTSSIWISGERSRRTLSHAINAPVGIAAKLLVKLLNPQSPGKESGIPSVIKSRFERLITAPGDGSDHAVCVVASYIQWLNWIDPDWVRCTVVPWFGSAHENWEPAWNGFLHSCGALPEPDLFSLLKPHFLNVFPSVSSCLLEDDALRKLHHVLVCGCYLCQENSAYISYAEARRALQQTNDQGRAESLFFLKDGVFFGDREKWNRFAKPFLDEAWPKEAPFRTENTSKQLAGLAVDSGDLLPDVVQTILPHLVPVSQDHSLIYEISQKDGKLSESAKRNPESILTLLDKLVPHNPGITPYGLDEAVETIADSKPSLRQDNRWRRLKAIAIRR